jgi:hypothetical protein
MSSKRGEAPWKIMARLEKGPAYPWELEKDLCIPYKTILYNLTKSNLKNFNIVKKLDDGRYALKSYSDEENRIRNSYEVLSRKLLRSPTPDEFAGQIKNLPDAARNLLFKYLPDYCEAHRGGDMFGRHPALEDASRMYVYGSRPNYKQEVLV